MTSEESHCVICVIKVTHKICTPEGVYCTQCAFYRHWSFENARTFKLVGFDEWIAAYQKGRRKKLRV